MLVFVLDLFATYLVLCVCFWGSFYSVISALGNGVEPDVCVIWSGFWDL
jgi:hypothetical protein